MKPSLACLCLLPIFASSEDVRDGGPCKEDTGSLSLSLLQNNIALKPSDARTAAAYDDAQTGLSIARRGHEDFVPKLQATNAWATHVSECLSIIIPRLEGLNLACSDQCGSISRDFKQSAAYMELASSSSVTNICETGFYQGHSSAVWLCANPSAHLYSFDLEFPSANLKAIQDFFGDRFTYFEGDSAKTLTQFAADPGSPFCDIMVADGGHFGEVPWNDLNNFAKISARQPDRKHTLLVDEVYFHQTQIGCCMDVTKSLEKALSLNMLDTQSSYCQSFECFGETFDDPMSNNFPACHLNPITRFPLVGEVTLNSTYPHGGYCIMGFAKDFLETI